MSAEERWSCVLKNHVYGLGLAWDNYPGQAPLDLDLQAVIVDENGQIVDAVYFNNSFALKGAVQMAGDHTTGESEGLDESIWVRINKLPQAVKMVIFVVAAYSGGCLADAENGFLRICEGDTHHVIKQIPIEHSCAQAGMVAMLIRDAEGIWIMEELKEPAETGSHFLDILEPMIGDLIRSYIHGAPEQQTVSFQMGKGSLIDLPHRSTLKRVIIAIGGEMPDGCEFDADIDVSAVFFSTSGKALGAVDHDRLQMFGLRHSGDGSAASSDLDDEAICVNMEEIPDCVSQIFILMTVKDGTFQNVTSAYARVTDHLCTDLARFDFSGGIDEQGLVIGRFFRSPSHRWGFQAYGSFCKGPTWKEAQPELKALFLTPPHTESGVRRTLTKGKAHTADSGATPQKPAGKKKAPKAAKEVSEAPPQEGTAEANAAKKHAGENPVQKKKTSAKAREAAPEVAGTEESSLASSEVKAETDRQATRSTDIRSWKPCNDVPASCRTVQRNLDPSEPDTSGNSPAAVGKALRFSHSKRRVSKLEPTDAEQAQAAAAAAPMETNEERPVDERREVEEQPAQQCTWMCGRGRLW